MNESLSKLILALLPGAFGLFVQLDLVGSQASDLAAQSEWTTRVVVEDCHSEDEADHYAN